MGFEKEGRAMSRWNVPILTILTASAWLAGMVRPSLAVDLYVDNLSGSDRCNGYDPKMDAIPIGPVKTIAAALRRASAGDRIVLTPTGHPYREALVIAGGRLPGKSRFPLVIEGNGCELDGSRPVEAYRWQYRKHGLYELDGPSVFRGGLWDDGKPLDRVDTPSWSSDRPNLEPGAYCLWRGSYWLRLKPQDSVRDHGFAENRLKCGLTIHRASYVIIRNLRIRGFELDGAQIRGPVRSVRFERCLFGANGRAGVSAYTNSDVSLSGCFVEDNSRDGVLAENFSDLSLHSCAISGSPNEILSDANSKVARSGPVPEPLPPAPESLRPTPKPRPTEPMKPVEPAATKPSEPSETPTPPRKRKRPTFFDP